MIFDFNNDWLFCRQDGEPKTVTLPHDAMLEEPRQKNCHNGKDCGYFPGGKYSYEKHFAVPQEYPEQKVSILFDGVYQNAVVYLNGEPVAKSPVWLHGIYRRHYRKSAERGKLSACDGGQQSGTELPLVYRQRNLPPCASDGKAERRRAPGKDPHGVDCSRCS